MKVTRIQLRRLLEQASEDVKKQLTKDAIKDQIKKTVGDPEDEGGEGGAAGLQAVKDGLEELEKEEDAKRPEDLDSDKKIEDFIEKELPDDIKKHDSGDYVATAGLEESISLSRKELRRLIKEELKRLSYVSKEQGHTYGLEHLPDQYDQKKADDIIGHTWLTHVRKKGSSLNEVGYVLWHSLNESGEINYYDVEWPDGSVETDIPARLLEKVKDSSEADSKNPHEGHGIKGHKEKSLVSERKYKKRKSKKKSTKKKPKYWYLGGYGIDYDHDFADFGGDFGGDGGGEWK